MKTIQKIGFFAGFLILISPLGLSGQSLTPQVLSNAGGSFSQNGVKMSWTLGETAVMHFSTEGGSVTEGFHQPGLQIFGLDASAIVAIKIAPNPVQSTLNVQIPSANQSEWVATLSDEQGRILLRRTHLQSGNTELDLSHYPSGVYFLGMQETGKNVPQSFKVVKTQ
jgi:hypothetical protein